MTPYHPRSPRLEVVSLVQGQSEDGHAVRVVNISTGGALVHSTQLLSVNDMHEFRFMSDDPNPNALVFQARVAHVRHMSEAEPGCFAGLEFLEQQTGRQSLAVRRLIDRCCTPSQQPGLFSTPN